MAVPSPPDKLKPLLGRWPANESFVRIYRLPNRPDQFESRGTGARGRFHFFADDSGTTIPILYGAEIEDAATAETVFRDVRSGGKVSLTRLADLALVRLTPRHDLTLIELHGYGLKRLDLHPNDLTSTAPDEYPRTVAWAKALHAAAPRAQGLVWMSHQFNTSRAVMLFGDRVDESALMPSPPIPLSSGAGLSIVQRCANEAGITIL